MATIVERLWKQILETFSKSGINSQVFDENFRKLKGLTDQITARDLKFNLDILEQKRAPVTYIEIYEDQNVTVGIFVVRRGAKLPLHDHPHMCGILKVIAGKVNIQSYSVKSVDSVSNVNMPSSRSSPIFRNSRPKQVLNAEKFPVVSVTEKDSACILTPLEKNLHEIKSVDGPAAFLDILSPPYDSDQSGRNERACHYFVEQLPLSTDLKLPDNFVKLIEIECPSSFWCDTDKYVGLPLR